MTLSKPLLVNDFLTIADIKNIVKDYQNNETYATIILKYNISRKTLRKILVSNGLVIRKNKRKNKRFGKYQANQIINSYLHGVKTHQLAVRYNVSDDVIRNLIHRNNLQILRVGRRGYASSMSPLAIMELIDDFNNGVNIDKLSMKYQLDKKYIWPLIGKFMTRHPELYAASSCVLGHNKEKEARLVLRWVILLKRSGINKFNYLINSDSFLNDLNSIPLLRDVLNLEDFQLMQNRCEEVIRELMSKDSIFNDPVELDSFSKF